MGPLFQSGTVENAAPSHGEGIPPTRPTREPDPMKNTRRLVLTLAFALALAVEPALAYAQAEVADLRVSARTVSVLIGTAIFGGIVSWIAKVRAGTVGAASVTYLVGEVCTSAFAGFLCFLACDAAGLSLKLSILLTGIAGHMGTRAIAWFESWAERKWNTITGTPPAASSDDKGGMK